MTVSLENKVEDGVRWPKAARFYQARTWLRFLTIRFGLGLFVLWGTVSLVFVALQLLPGDPVEIIYGGENRPTTEQRAQITRDFGLDQPLVSQYTAFVSTYLTGDLGTSYLQRRPVAEIIGAELRPTTELALAASIIAIVVAFTLALATAGNRRGRLFGL
jgi:peptide/nickel transport system permease protein